MNKSTLERLTHLKVRRLSKEHFGLFNGDSLILDERGKKESIVYQKLNDSFWVIRRQEIMVRDGYRCRECGSPFGIQVDHFVNRSQGGTHDPSNLNVLCSDCHYRKTNNMGKWSKRNAAG